MNVKFSRLPITSDKSDIVGFFVSEKDEEQQIAKIKSSLGVSISSAFSEDFKAKENTLSFLYIQHEKINRLAFIGLGSTPTLDTLRSAAALFASKAKALKLEHASLDLSSLSDLAVTVSDSPHYTLQVIVEGFLSELYEYDKFKTNNIENFKNNTKPTKEQKKNLSLTVHIKNASSSKLDEVLHHASIVIDSQCNARDLVNAPSNHLSATDLSNYIKVSGKRHGYKVTVFDKAKIQSLNMGGIIGVNKGSTEPPTFNILEHKPTKPKLKVALIGKGVMFDTGGISIKPAQGMGEMKADMAGAAAVVGAVEVAARLNLPIHLYGIIPATDNKPSGSAQNPGDVLTTYSGITVEVDNTDAEGRLILADALSYTQRVLHPDIMIDLATLTGACVVALGSVAAGLFSNNKDTATKLYQAGMRSGEKVWRLPLWSEYDPLIKSSIADVKNTGSGGAGAVTAAKFLEKFTGGHNAWVHLDIAGPAIPKFMNSGGGNNNALPAFGVRLLTEFLRNL